jgi:hypothetical protein
MDLATRQPIDDARMLDVCALAEGVCAGMLIRGGMIQWGGRACDQSAAALLEGAFNSQVRPRFLAGLKKFLCSDVVVARSSKILG